MLFFNIIIIIIIIIIILIQMKENSLQIKNQSEPHQLSIANPRALFQLF